MLGLNEELSGQSGHIPVLLRLRWAAPRPSCANECLVVSSPMLMSELNWTKPLLTYDHLSVQEHLTVICLNSDI